MDLYFGCYLVRYGLQKAKLALCDYLKQFIWPNMLYAFEYNINFFRIYNNFYINLNSLIIALKIKT